MKSPPGTRGTLRALGEGCPVELWSRRCRQPAPCAPASRTTALFSLRARVSFGNSSEPRPSPGHAAVGARRRACTNIREQRRRPAAPATLECRAGLRRRLRHLPLLESRGLRRTSAIRRTRLAPKAPSIVLRVGVPATASRAALLVHVSRRRRRRAWFPTWCLPSRIRARCPRLRKGAGSVSRRQSAYIVSRLIPNISKPNVYDVATHRPSEVGAEGGRLVGGRCGYGAICCA